MSKRIQILEDRLATASLGPEEVYRVEKIIQELRDEMIFNILDRVYHVDYPEEVGTIIEKRVVFQGDWFFVRWDRTGSASLHASSALRHK
tara:strand:- start:14775 stop:15044 length:270 start_codon:yes stop_codon:yes gene_type:complete